MAIVQLPAFYDASNFAPLDLIPFWRVSDGSMFNITYDELYVQLEASIGGGVSFSAWNGLTLTDSSLALGGILNDGITDIDASNADAGGINFGVNTRLSEFQANAAAITLTTDELIVSGLNTTTGDTPYALVMDVVDSSIAYRQLGSMAWNTGTDYVLKAGDTMTGPLTISAGGLSVANDVSITGDLLVSGDTTFAGDVNIDGSLFITSIETIDVSGRFIVLNTGQTGTPPSTMQSGIVIDRGDLDPYVFLFDESTEDFRIGIAPVDASNSFDDASTQAVATREDTPISGGYAIWNSTLSRFDTSTSNFITGNASDNYIAVGAASPNNIEAAIGFTYNGPLGFGQITGNSNSDTGLSAVNNDTTTGGARWVALVNATTTGDAYIQLGVESERYYALGIDNSDSDKLKLTTNAVSAGTPSDASILLTIDPVSQIFTFNSNVGGGDASLFLNAAGTWATPDGTGGGGTDVSVFWQEDPSDNTNVVLIDPSQNVQLSAIEVEEDGGTVQLVNMPVSTAPTLGTQESYTFDMDGSVALKIYGRASGSGALTETAVVVEATYQYMGDPNTNGSWRFYVDGSANLTFEKRVAGTWTFGGQFT